MSAYCLVTPARNEGPFIENTIKSVLAQKIRPVRWVIVSDNSTDETEEIVKRYASQHDFIKLISRSDSKQRSFGAKARAFQLGLAAIDCDWDFIGNLDADITFDSDYYASILQAMRLDPQLGIATGVCWDKTSDGFRKVTITLNHSVGAVQLFRKKCFTDIGGYTQTSVGGVDSIATLSARMKGWRTQCLPDIPVYHHKPVDSASGGNALRIAYRAGLTEYHIGTIPTFAIAKAIRRWNEKPIFVGSIVRLWAYMKLLLSGAKRDASPELIHYLKAEQRRRLTGWLYRNGHHREATTTNIRSAAKACLLGAGFTTGNFGVWALASGSIDAFLAANPNGNIDIVDFARAPASYTVRTPHGSDLPVRLINLRFTKKIWLRNSIVRLLITALLRRLIPGKSLRARLTGNAYLKELDATGVFLSIAGGDSFSDIYGMSRLFYVTLPQLLALALSKPLVQMPQTYGPFATATGRFFARFLLRRSQFIYTRDVESLKLLEELLGKNASPKPQFSYDLGFLLQPKVPTDSASASIINLLNTDRVVGLNVSGLLWMGGYNRQNMFGLSCDYKDIIRRTLDWVICKQNRKVLLVPHVVSASKSDESDNGAIASMKSELATRYGDKIVFVAHALDHAQTKYLIGKCDIFIGARMHACIAAISQCVPTVAMAYSKKFSGVVGGIGPGVVISDLCNATSEQVLEIVQAAVQNADNMRESLQTVVPRIREEALLLFTHQNRVQLA